MGLGGLGRPKKLRSEPLVSYSNDFISKKWGLAQVAIGSSYQSYVALCSVSAMRRLPAPCRPWCHSGTPFVHSGCVLRQWTSSGCRNFVFGESTRGHIGPGSMVTWATGPATAATAAGFRIQVGISPTRRWATMSSSLESAVLELLWIREWPSLHVWRCRSHAPHIVRAPKARVGRAYTHFSLDWFGATSSGVCRQPTSPCSMASLAPTDEWVAGMETGGFDTDTLDPRVRCPLRVRGRRSSCCLCSLG